MAFALGRQPRAQRTQRWTKARHGFAPSWEKEHRGAHFSRFLDLARPTLHPPKAGTLSPREWQAVLFHFASAVIADLRDGIDAACPPGRCAESLTEADQKLAAFVRAGATAFTHAETTRAAERTGTWYGWRLTGPDAAFELGCDDAADLPEVRCRLDLDLGDEQVLRYVPRSSAAIPGPDITLRRREAPVGVNLGEIQFDRTFAGAPVVIVAGAALAMH
jgi:hypothetical protein